MNALTITDATVDDATEILAVQKAAYTIEARLYGDAQIPPLTQTEDELRAQFSDHVVLKAVEDDRIVGSVRASVRDGTCFVGRLCVLPERQGHGIGTSLMKAIEARLPDAKRFDLFTGSLSVNTIRLYERLGYREFKREPQMEGVELVFLCRDDGTGA